MTNWWKNIPRERIAQIFTHYFIHFFQLFDEKSPWNLTKKSAIYIVVEDLLSYCFFFFLTYAFLLIENSIEFIFAGYHVLSFNRYGRVKPDVVAYGREIMGSKISTGCKSLSGTSVASPVVAGIVCLLVSIIPENKRKQILNPGSMKQALVEGASKLSGPNMYEQGAGRVDL